MLNEIPTLAPDGLPYRLLTLRNRAWKLVRVTYKNDPRVLVDALEELLCQPHIHHRKLVHDDEVGIHKANALAVSDFFPGAEAQRTV